jgi:hypothetical protein
VRVVLRCACGWSCSDIGPTSRLHADARDHLESQHPERIGGRGFGRVSLAEVLRHFLHVEQRTHRSQLAGAR